MTDPSVGVEAAGAGVAQHRGDHWIARVPWTSAAARDRLLGGYLDDDEAAWVAALAPASRDGRALGRIVAKEAARHWLADRGERPFALRAIRIVSLPDGRPQVTVAGRVAPMSVSLAHCGRVAVAAVATAAAGIDVEAIEPRGSVFARLALTGDELRLGRGNDHDEWVTRLWTVKEAVAKAAGTGLRGRPKDIVVHRVEGDLAWAGGRVVRSVRYGRLVVSTAVPRPDR